MSEKIGETIYIICDYRFLKGTLLGVGKKNYKVRFRYSGAHLESAKYIEKEKCAFPGEKVLFVWETWKGKNGRGGYRLERHLYPELRVDADLIELGSHSFKSIGHFTEDQKQSDE